MGGNPFGKKTFWEKTLWFFLEEIPLGETPFFWEETPFLGPHQETVTSPRCQSIPGDPEFLGVTHPRAVQLWVFGLSCDPSCDLRALLGTAEL